MENDGLQSIILGFILLTFIYYSVIATSYYHLFCVLLQIIFCFQSIFYYVFTTILPFYLISNNFPRFHIRSIRDKTPIGDVREKQNMPYQNSLFQFLLYYSKLRSRTTMGACVMLCNKKELSLPDNEIKYIQSQVQAQLHADQHLQLPSYQKQIQEDTKNDEEKGGCVANMSKSTKTSSKSRFFVEKSIKSNEQSRQQGEDSINQTSFTQKMSEKFSDGLDRLDFIDEHNQKIVFYHHSNRIGNNENIKASKGQVYTTDSRLVEVIVKNKKMLLFKKESGKKNTQKYEGRQQLVKQNVINTQITYDDQSSYEGDTVLGLRHGKGKYFWKDGTVYEGQWKQDNIQGYGILSFIDGEQYKGNFLKNKASGKGQFSDFTGLFYQGQWQNGLEDGKGSQSFKNQQKYDGGWSAGKKEGYGELFYFDGSYYKGNFSNNQINGKGEYSWVGKSTYKGYWLHNQKCGIGSIIWQNGDRYQGQFLYDKMHGMGKYYCKNGVIYEGIWQKGRKQGKFKQISSSGEVKESFWVFNKKIQQPNRRQSNIIKKIIKQSKLPAL